MRSVRMVVALLVTLVLVGHQGGAASAADVAVEQEFVDLTNQTRANAGHGRVLVDVELTAIARRWSAQMASENRLAHNPSLSREVSQDWQKLGENVGTGDNAPQIHDAFMRSPAHRANILDGEFTHVGVGVVRSADGRIWVTQVFMLLRSGSAGSSPGAPSVTSRPGIATPPAGGRAPASSSPSSATTTTAATTTTVPLPAPPPTDAHALQPRYVLVLDGLARLDRGR